MMYNGDDSPKIGIMTYHRAENYGSVLQAYALNRYLRKLGYRAETIDYRNKTQEDMYRLWEPVRSPLSLARNLQTLLYYGALKRKKKQFEAFRRDCLPTSAKIFDQREQLEQLSGEYSVFVCGSDQIWNTRCRDFDDAYLLSFLKDKRSCVAYAPSLGASELSMDSAQMFAHELRGFRALSAREAQGALSVGVLLGREVSCVLDPVFLLTPAEWESMAADGRVKGAYIFCYFVGEINGMRAFARQMRDQLGLPLVVVYKNLRDMLYANHKRYDAGPEEFLGLIRNAAYICTNSFHAVAFSILFQKRFWAFVNEGDYKADRCRIGNLVRICGLQDRVLTAQTLGGVQIETDIDFRASQAMIAREIQRSRQFLEEAAKGALSQDADL